METIQEAITVKTLINELNKVKDKNRLVVVEMSEGLAGGIQHLIDEVVRDGELIDEPTTKAVILYVD